MTVGAAAQDKPSTQNMAKQTKAAISAYQKADSLKDRDKAIAHLKKSINIYLSKKLDQSQLKKAGFKDGIIVDDMYWKLGGLLEQKANEMARKDSYSDKQMFQAYNDAMIAYANIGRFLPGSGKNNAASTKLDKVLIPQAMKYVKN